MADQKTPSKKKDEEAQPFDFAKFFGMDSNGQSGGFFQMLTTLFTALLGGQGLGSLFSNMGQKTTETFQEVRKTVKEASHNVVETGKKAVERTSDFISNGYKGLLDLIGKHESAGDYNRVYAAKGVKREDLTNMTLNQVMDFQRGYLNEQAANGVPAKHRSSASGKYQMNYATMKDTIAQMGLTGNEKFDVAMQDKMAQHLIEHRGVNKKTGDIEADRIAKIWASMPKENGRGAYDGDGINKAIKNTSAVRAVIESANDERNGRTVVASNDGNGIKTKVDVSALNEHAAAPDVKIAANNKQTHEVRYYDTPVEDRKVATAAPTLSQKTIFPDLMYS